MLVHQEASLQRPYRERASISFPQAFESSLALPYLPSLSLHSYHCLQRSSTQFTLRPCLTAHSIKLSRDSLLTDIYYATMSEPFDLTFEEYLNMDPVLDMNLPDQINTEWDLGSMLNEDSTTMFPANLEIEQVHNWNFEFDPNWATLDAPDAAGSELVQQATVEPSTDLALCDVR